MPPEMDAKLVETARREERPVSTVVRRALRTYWQVQEQQSGGQQQQAGTERPAGGR